MATLIASTAQVDHLLANEAQNKLSNLIRINTVNDVSLSILMQQASQTAAQLARSSSDGSPQENIQTVNEHS